MRLLILTAALAMLAVPVSAQEIKAVTAELPPYTIGPGEAQPGINHELVEEIAKRSGVDITIEYMPWKRAQSYASDTKNTLVFGLTRTEAREPNYSWITKLVDSSDVFVTTGDPVNSYEEAKNLSKIAVLDGTPRKKALDAEEFGNQQVVPNVELGARMLKAGRVDGWYTVDHRAAYVWKSEGNPLSELTFGDAIQTSEIWLAGNKDMDAGSVEKIKAAMEEIRADGTYEAIFNKYVGD